MCTVFIAGCIAKMEGNIRVWKKILFLNTFIGEKREKNREKR